MFISEASFSCNFAVLLPPDYFQSVVENHFYATITLFLPFSVQDERYPNVFRIDTFICIRKT